MGGPRSTYDESEQALIVEDLGEITANHKLDEGELSSYNPEAESIIASTAVKALIGDRDTEKNIAYCHESGEFRAFDFDKAGNRISSSFESAVDTAEELVEASGYSSDKERLREGLAKYMREIAQQADLEGMSEQLEDNPHGEQVLQNFKTAMNYESGEDPRYHFLQTWNRENESQEAFAL